MPLVSFFLDYLGLLDAPSVGLFSFFYFFSRFKDSGIEEFNMFSYKQSPHCNIVFVVETVARVKNIIFIFILLNHNFKRSY